MSRRTVTHDSIDSTGYGRRTTSVSSSSSSYVPTTRTRVTPAVTAATATPTPASSNSRLPASSSFTSSSSRPQVPPAATEPEYDLESLLGWDRTRAADRARTERERRDRILAHEKELERERRQLQRIGGESRELDDLIAQMMLRATAHHNSGDGFDDEHAGPVLDANGQAKKLSMVLRCFSFGVVGKEQLQMGDKIILPPEALYQVQKIRLPFPLLFRIENCQNNQKKLVDKFNRAASGNSSAASSAAPVLPAQYVGVLEFSAPEEHIYLPSWLMENLHLTEGSTVKIFSEVDVPQGKWVKLVPHSIEFSKILREMGPKYFLEMALRHYSVLTKGQRIVIQHAGVNYSLNVEDVKPSPTISLLGNLDLEVEFGIALDTPAEQRPTEASGDGSVTFRSRVSGGHALPAAGAEDEDEDFKRALVMSLAESGQSPIESTAAAISPSRLSQPSASSAGADEGWAMGSSSRINSPSAAIASSLQARFGGNRLASHSSNTTATPVESKEDVEANLEKDEAQPTQEEADEESEEEAVEEAIPIELPTNHSLCPSCQKPISNASFSLHTLHCARAFTKCPVCAKMVKKIEAEAHAASHVTVACPDCQQQLQQKKLRKHQKKECAYRPATCQWCAQPQPLIQLPSHEAACSLVTQECKVCQQPIARRDLAIHPNSEGCRVECTKCSEIVAAKNIVAHMKDSCSGRMIACPHCKLSFPQRETVKHQEYCGSRTEQCDSCQRYIKLRDMELHLDSKCALPLVEEKKYREPSVSPPARASPTLGASNPAGDFDRMTRMLEANSQVDPALLARLFEFEDPLASAAARSSGSGSSSSLSTAARQAKAAREKLSRALDAAEAAERSSDDDEEDYLLGRGGSRSNSSRLTQPKPTKPITRATARRSPSPSVAVATSAGRSAGAAAASNPRRSPPPSGAGAAAESSFTCAYCQDKCASLESLQVHILTECSDAHATMEVVDPAAAAKALAGKAKEVEREHVSIKVPVAKPVTTRTTSNSSASSTPIDIKPFDPYDYNWKAPQRDPTEELRRHTAGRKSSGIDLVDSDDDSEELEALPSRRSTVAAPSAATKPKLFTSNSRLKSNDSNPSSAPAAATSKRSSLLADDPPAYPSTSTTSTTKYFSRASVPVATPLSLKLQQRELERSMAERKAKEAIASIAAAKMSARSSTRSYADDSAEGSSPVAPVSQPSTALRYSSGTKVAGLSPNFMAGLGADVPSRTNPSSTTLSSTRATKPELSSYSSSPASVSASRDDETYEQWVARNHPASARLLSGSPATITSSTNPSSSYGSARGGPTSPLSTLLSNARSSAATSGVGSSYAPYPTSSIGLNGSSRLSGGNSSSTDSGRYDLPSHQPSRKTTTTSPHVPSRQPATQPSTAAASTNSSSSTRVPSATRTRTSSTITTTPSTTTTSPHVPLYSSSATSASGPRKIVTPTRRKVEPKN